MSKDNKPQVLNLSDPLALLRWLAALETLDKIDSILESVCTGKTVRRESGHGKQSA